MAVDTIVYLKKKRTSNYIQSKEIARELEFSVGYLQKVVQTLSKSGILECKRGRIGGVRIGSNNITLLDLWEATCGSLNFTDPSIDFMKKPLKTFKEAMANVIIYKKPGKKK